MLSTKVVVLFVEFFICFAKFGPILVKCELNVQLPLYLLQPAGHQWTFRRGTNNIQLSASMLRIPTRSGLVG